MRGYHPEIALHSILPGTDSESTLYQPVLFVMLWITIGLSLLVLFGIDDLVMYISLEPTEGAEEVPHSPVYFALCLTIMVIVWPLILLEYVQKRS
jgi:hypothetical protein